MWSSVPVTLASRKLRQEDCRESFKGSLNYTGRDCQMNEAIEKPGSVKLVCHPQAVGKQGKQTGLHSENSFKQ